MRRWAVLLVGWVWVGAGMGAEKPLTLEDAIAEAVANNLELAAEKANVSVVEAREIGARLRPNPVLSVSGQTLNAFGAKFGPDSPLGPNQWNVQTEVPIERGGKREQRVALAREEKTLAELGVREVMRQVIAGVQSAFVDVQQAQDKLALAQENLKTLESLVAINEARLQAGDLAQVELERSRVAALQYRTAVEQAQLEVEQAKIQLQLVMGRKAPRTDLEVSGGWRRDVVEETPEELTRRALTERPDYQAAGQARVRSRADLRLQVANAKVDYSVGVEFTRQWAYGMAGNTAGVYFSVPLPVRNRNQGEVARAERETVLAGARMAALELAIRGEVEKAYRQYVVARRLLENIETEMLGKARSVRETTEYSYKRGEASLVEYLDAQRAFNDAMQAFNDARASYARSLYLMDTVTGATVRGR
jgi:cobalt-zinc-cadmium efflux system outer membrane protein